MAAIGAEAGARFNLSACPGPTGELIRKSYLAGPATPMGALCK